MGSNRAGKMVLADGGRTNGRTGERNELAGRTDGPEYSLQDKIRTPRCGCV